MLDMVKNRSEMDWSAAALSKIRSALGDTVETGMTLPPACFTDAEFYDKEVETIFKKEWAPYTVPFYAILEGLALGSLSYIYFATSNRSASIILESVWLCWAKDLCTFWYVSIAVNSAYS